VLVDDQGDRDAGGAQLAGQGGGLSSSGRLVARVGIFSWKIRVTPAAAGESSWLFRDWRVVEARRNRSARAQPARPRPQPGEAVVRFQAQEAVVAHPGTVSCTCFAG